MTSALGLVEIVGMVLAPLLLVRFYLCFMKPSTGRVRGRRDYERILLLEEGEVSQPQRPKVQQAPIAKAERAEAIRRFRADPWSRLCDCLAAVSGCITACIASVASVPLAAAIRCALGRSAFILDLGGDTALACLLSAHHPTWARLVGFFVALPYLVLACLLWPSVRDKMHAGRPPLDEMPMPECVTGVQVDCILGLLWAFLAIPYLAIADFSMAVKYLLAKPTQAEAMHYMALRRIVGAVGEADFQLPLQLYIWLRLANPRGLLPPLEHDNAVPLWLLALNIASSAYTVFDAYNFTRKFAALQTQDNKQLFWTRMCSLGQGLMPASLLREFELQQKVVVTLNLSHADIQSVAALCLVARKSRVLQSVTFTDCRFLLPFCNSVVDRVACRNALRDLILCPSLRHLEFRGAQLPPEIIDDTVCPSLQKHPSLRAIHLVEPDLRLVQLRNAFADRLEKQPPILRAVWAEDLRGTLDVLAAGGLPSTAEPTDRETAVHLAARRGCVPILRELLLAEGGSDAAATVDDFGQTALHLAAEHGHMMATELLLISGLGVNAKAKCGRTPLWRAAANGSADVTGLLVKWGADMNSADAEGGLSPMFIAAQLGHAQIVQVLLSHDADVHQGEASGATPLYVASYSGHLLVVRTLLENEAEVNQARISGATPLFVAAQNGHLDVVTALLDFDADVDPRKRSGATPLFVASQDGHASIVRLLLAKSADVHRALNDGAAPLFVAAQNGHVAVVHSLLRQRASINQARNDGATAKHVAAQNGFLPVVQVLKACDIAAAANKLRGTTTPPYGGSTTPPYGGSISPPRLGSSTPPRPGSARDPMKTWGFSAAGVSPPMGNVTPPIAGCITPPGSAVRERGAHGTDYPADESMKALDCKLKRSQLARPQRV